MAQLLPFRSDPDTDQTPRLVNIDDEETADEVFAALSSEMARNILSELYEEPTTASELAESVDTSLQNARYHLDKLQSAGLVKEVDTWYSSRGTEMTVYGPTNDPLVVTAGGQEHAAVLRDAVKRLLGAIGILGLASLLINRVARDFGPTTDQPVSAGDAGGADGPALRVATENVSATTTEQVGMMDAAGGAGDAANATGTPTPMATPEPTPTQAPTTALKEATETMTPAAFSDGAAASDGGILATTFTEIPPGGLFFAGGLLILLVASAWWYFARYRVALS